MKPPRLSMATGAGRRGPYFIVLLMAGIPTLVSGARTVIHWLVRSTGPCFAHPEALWMGIRVPASCVTYRCPHLGTGKQMEGQTEMQGDKRTRRGNREETGLWAVNAHPTTTSGPSNDWQPSGFCKGKQPPPYPDECFPQPPQAWLSCCRVNGRFPHQWR